MRALLGPHLGASVHVVVPGRAREAIVDLDHADAVRHRTHNLAKVAADTLGIDDFNPLPQLLNYIPSATHFPTIDLGSLGWRQKGLK